MDTVVNTCPHCGSQDNRMLTDHLGSVGWCGECFRAWIPPTPWTKTQRAVRVPVKRPAARERLGQRRIA